MSHDFIQHDAARSVESQSYKGASTIVKCLTEIVINSHESYIRLRKEREKDAKPIQNPYVLIKANRENESFEVIDHFEGLAESWKEAEDILSVKSRRQETHTAESRSAMGRGMSDVLFRRSQNVSILGWRRNGKTFAYKCLYEPDKQIDGELQRTFKNELSQDPFLQEELEKLIPENGTYVKFFWKKKVEEETFPTKDQIKEMLGHYYELKNILSMNDFTIYLEYVDKNGKSEREPVRFVKYDFDEVGAIPETKIDIKIPERLKQTCRCMHHIQEHTQSKCNKCECKNFQGKKYDIKILSAKLYKSKTRLNTEHDDKRTQGLYIEGEHKQVYTMEFFGLEDKYGVDAPYYFGTVILSKDAKNYMMDMYNIERIEILSQTRTGFEKTKKNDLFHKMKSVLKPWLESILKTESHISVEFIDYITKAGIDKINQIMKEIGEVDDAKGTVDGMDEPEGTGPEGPGPKPPIIPQYAEFEYKSYQIIIDKPQRVNLMVNPEKFRAGSKIEWGHTDSSVKISASVNNVPAAEGKQVIKIPVIIKSDSLGDIGTIYVKMKTTDGKLLDPLPSAILRCIDEPELEIFQPHEVIEFNPKNVKAKPLKSRSVDLYTHGNIVKPGTPILISFDPEPGHSKLEPISFTMPILRDAAPPEFSFNFSLQDSECLIQQQNYRKTKIKFEGIQPGLGGILVAKTVVDNNEYVAKCLVSFESEGEGGNSGFLKDWTAERLPGNPKAWVYEEQLAIANLSLPHVNRILGNNERTAKLRNDLYEEARLFVASGIMSVAFEQALVSKIEGHDKELEKQGVGAIDRYKSIMSRKDDWERLYADEIFKEFKLFPRTVVPEEGISENKITTEFSFPMELLLKSYQVSGDQHVFDASFPTHDLAGDSKRTTFKFKCMDEELTIGVYQFKSGVIAVRFDSFEWGTDAEEVLLRLREDYQVYKKAENQIEGISDDWVFTPVIVSLFEKNVMKKIPISLDKINLIPDSPQLVNGIPVEIDNTWVYENNPVVKYKSFGEAISNNPTNSSQLISFLDPNNLHYLALNFLRHRIIRPLSTHYYILKYELSQNKPVKCKTCNFQVSTEKEIRDTFGFYYDDKTPEISKFCIAHK